MPRYTRIIADLVKQTARTDGDANARARSFVARLSGVLEAQGHQALANELFAILDDSVTTVRQAPKAVQREFTERFGAQVLTVPDEV